MQCRELTKPLGCVLQQLDLALIDVIDLVADLDKKLTVVDFQTAASAYQKQQIA
jgi:hypothetical protein